jgi:signal transduction histidine kinase/ActR/RegA family two-component response regulator
MGNYCARKRAPVPQPPQAQMQELQRSGEPTVNERRAAVGRVLEQVSHDFRTPLNGIVATVDLLALTELNEQQRDLVTTLKSSCDLTLALVSDVLDVARIEGGRLELRSQKFNIVRALHPVVDRFRELAQEKSLTLSLDVAEPAAAHDVVGDQDRFQRIIHDLLTSSISYTEKGSIAIQVSTESINDPNAPAGAIRAVVSLTFVVCDTGSDLDIVAEQQLFTPFQEQSESERMQRGHHRRSSSSGMGLFVARYVARLMGGDVIVVPGLGGLGWTLTFTARLPLARALDTTEEAGPAELWPFETVSSSPRTPGTPLEGRVLVVDDMAVNCAVARRLLTHMGLTVDIAGNGMTAVPMAKQTRYSLILMDIQMPFMDGLTATELIRVQERERGVTRVPILGFTAAAMEDNLARCLSAGMDGVIAKPDLLEEMRKNVLNHMRRERRTPLA